MHGTHAVQPPLFFWHGIASDAFPGMLCSPPRLISTLRSIPLPIYSKDKVIAHLLEQGECELMLGHVDVCAQLRSDYLNAASCHPTAPTALNLPLPCMHPMRMHPRLCAPQSGRPSHRVS